MTETELRKIIEEINPVDREAMKQAEGAGLTYWQSRPVRWEYLRV